MADDDEEYLQDKLSEAARSTKIAHYGPCPEWKGHCFECDFFILGMLLGFGVGFFIMATLVHAFNLHG